MEWSYGSIFSERDINEHGVHNAVYNTSIMAVLTGAEPPVSAENMAKQLADQSGLGDPLCFDWSEEGIYSDARVREIHWNRAYGRFWLQSLGMCDWVWPNFISRKHTAETGSTYGATPEYEVKFFQAVTGRDLSYEESIELGHKFWVLDRAIWALEGRHRDQEVFTNYVYDVKTTKPFPLVVFEDGKWSYSLCQGRTLDRDKFEDFKTRFYAHEGFEESTGRPTRSGLEALDLGFAADKLEDGHGSSRRDGRRHIPGGRCVRRPHLPCMGRGGGERIRRHTRHGRGVPALPLALARRGGPCAARALLGRALRCRAHGALQGRVGPVPVQPAQRSRVPARPRRSARGQGRRPDHQAHRRRRLRRLAARHGGRRGAGGRDRAGMSGRRPLPDEGA